MRSGVETAPAAHPEKSQNHPGWKRPLRSPSTSDRHRVCLKSRNQLLQAKAWEKVARRAWIWDPGMPVLGRATSAERETQGVAQGATRSSSTSTKPAEKFMDLINSTSTKPEEKFMDLSSIHGSHQFHQHQTRREIHGSHQFMDLINSTSTKPEEKFMDLINSSIS
ncbi:hypothetical protein DUI87_15038 [Hirundo rustica rustica]|uniref:Uncharacterized protein n=1 Tax=Hirundo rustica rustica TaxID=333673 RepID=A0A3M0KNQ9_HIRRU|nr:hypothetical protein DUI87_15038 [Hirundo rustica rustica]